MKQSTKWYMPLVFAISMLLSANVSADYSKSFEGYRTFKTYCFVCHGADGTGDGPLASKLTMKPADLTNDARLEQMSDRDLFMIIEGTAKHGQVSEDMPKWGLSIPQTRINSLVTYIRYLHRSKHHVPGSPQEGKQVYKENCTVCHGADGKGKGVLTTVYDMNPADHTDTKRMNNLTNERMRTVITNGSAGASLMPGWKNTLSAQEIDDVISYIRLLSAE